MRGSCWRRSSWSEAILEAARAAAAHALEAEPRNLDAQLASAMSDSAAARSTRADSLFRIAMPRLPRDVHERYDDIAPVSSEQDTAVFNHLGLVGKMEYLRRFWREADPDPATPENEAQLEYWARVTQAYFLYYNTRLRRVGSSAARCTCALDRRNPWSTTRSDSTTA